MSQMGSLEFHITEKVNFFLKNRLINQPMCILELRNEFKIFNFGRERFCSMRI
jgi:hypothetical protein